MKPVKQDITPFHNIGNYDFKLNNLKQTIQNLKERISKLENKLDDNYSLKKLKVATKDAIYFINYDNIRFLKSESNYTNIHLTSGKKLLISKTLGLLSNQIKDTNFMRIHASYFINLKYISEFQKSKKTVILEDGTKLPVSLSHKKELVKWLNK